MDNTNPSNHLTSYYTRSLASQISLNKSRPQDSNSDGKSWLASLPPAPQHRFIADQIDSKVTEVCRSQRVLQRFLDGHRIICERITKNLVVLKYMNHRWQLQSERTFETTSFSGTHWPGRRRNNTGQ